MSTPTPQIKTQASTPNIANISSPNPNTQKEDDTTQPSIEPALDTSTFLDASLFTFLPELYLIISRLKDLREPPASVTSTTNGVTQDDLTNTTSRESENSLRNTSTNSSNDANSTIEVRDLPGHLYSIRKGIADAKELVRGLPGIVRSCEEQESDIRDLKAEVGLLRTRLAKLGRIAEQVEDSAMEGVEDG